MLQVIYVSNNVYIQIKKKKKLMKYYRMVPSLRWRILILIMWCLKSIMGKYKYLICFNVANMYTTDTHFLVLTFPYNKKLYPLCQVYGILQKELNNRKSPTWVQQLQIFQKVVSKSLQHFSLQLNSQNHRIKPW